jgi:hypothetical protein
MTHEVAGHVRIELERRVGVEGRCKGVSSDVKMLERPCNAWNLIDVWYFCGLALQLTFMAYGQRNEGARSCKQDRMATHYPVCDRHHLVHTAW